MCMFGGEGRHATNRWGLSEIMRLIMAIYAYTYAHAYTVCVRVSTDTQIQLCCQEGHMSNGVCEQSNWTRIRWCQAT